jgi:hypothetical protein
MNFKTKDSVVNTLTGEVGVVVTTHTYPATDTGSVETSVASVKFSANETAKWVVTSCLKKL